MFGILNCFACHITYTQYFGVMVGVVMSRVTSNV
jgi:hypothetical protein